MSVEGDAGKRDGAQARGSSSRERVSEGSVYAPPQLRSELAWRRSTSPIGGRRSAIARGSSWRSQGLPFVIQRQQGKHPPALEAAALAGAVETMNCIVAEDGRGADEKIRTFAAARDHGATVGEFAALAVLLDAVPSALGLLEGTAFEPTGFALQFGAVGCRECGVTWGSIAEQEVRAVLEHGDSRMLTMFAAHNTLSSWLTIAIETGSVTGARTLVRLGVGLTRA